MRALILVAGAALTLAACGGNNDEAMNSDANLMVADNMATMDSNMMATDANMMATDSNMMMSNDTMMSNNMMMNGTDGTMANGTMNSTTTNGM